MTTLKEKKYFVHAIKKFVVYAEGKFGFLINTWYKLSGYTKTYQTEFFIFYKIKDLNPRLTFSEVCKIEKIARAGLTHKTSYYYEECQKEYWEEIDKLQEEVYQIEAQKFQKLQEEVQQIEAQKFQKLQEEKLQKLQKLQESLKDYTKEDIKAAIKKLPGLHFFGVGVYCQDRRNLSKKKQKAKLKKEQQDLLENVEMFAKTCVWLQQIEKRKTINEDAGSYQIKHLAEKDIGYITNGVFIAAAIHCGFPFKDVGFNVDFGMSSRSLNALRKYCIT